MNNSFVNIFKWPLAILAVVILPGLLGELFRVLLFIFGHFKEYLPLFAGAGSYWLVWYLLKGKNWGSVWFATLEHELTHALFATLTFNRVISIKASWSNGGHVKYKGTGNWLVTVSPYFVPTLALVVVIVGSFTGKHLASAIMVLTGFFLLYHIHTTWHQTHVRQSDIQKVGILFSLLFLPGANLFCFLCVLTMLPGDSLCTFSTLENVYKISLELMSFFKV
jgi:hypothetical protein